MSTAELPRPAERTVRPRPKKRSARPHPAEHHAISEPALADFLALEVRAVDAEKWPVSPVVWWQPELALRPPQTSGLRNERRHKTPVAGFLNLDLAPVYAAGAVVAPEPVALALAVRIPGSDLAPIGGDLRASSGKGRE